MRKFLTLTLTAAAIMIGSTLFVSSQQPPAKNVPPAAVPAPPMKVDAPPTATTTRAFVKHLNKFAHFIDREKQKAGHPMAKFSPKAIPATALPIDWTAGATVSCPMYGNDQWGDCMYAMACHCDNVRTFMLGRSTQSAFDLNTIVSRYRTLSGGDNGLSESQIFNEWKNHGLANIPAAKVIDELDIDVTNTALTRFAMNEGFDVCLMWSVPQKFLDTFDTGVVFDVPAVPIPENGHGTPLIDADAKGNYRLWTWGTWCWVTPAYVAAVQPSAFVVFSTRGIDPKTGLDAKGIHITQRAATWVQCGGKAIPTSVISAFPPPGGPPPPPPPPPPPNTLPPITLTGDLPKGTYQLSPAGSIPTIPSGAFDVNLTGTSTLNGAPVTVTITGTLTLTPNAAKHEAPKMELPKAAPMTPKASTVEPRFPPVSARASIREFRGEK